MLDFVPNHTALDNDWVADHPEYYVQAATSADCPPASCVELNGKYFYTGGDVYNSGWTDTVQLNYWNSATREAQISTLKSIASLADYIRCDMSMDILNDLIERAWGSKYVVSHLYLICGLIFLYFVY